MATVDLISLDDIIIQKKYTKSSGKVRGGVRRGQQRMLEGRRSQNQNSALNNKRVGYQGRRGGGGGGGTTSVSDARFKIIQKNRQKLTDARDKLVEIAKQSDARLKLEKLRECRKQGSASSKLSRSGASITRRTSRNGQITLTTNRKEIGQRQSSNKTDRSSGQGRRGKLLPRLMDLEIDLHKGSSPLIRRTVDNDMTALPPPLLFSPPVERNMYAWVNAVPKEPPSRSTSREEFSNVSRGTSRNSLLRSSPMQPTSLKITTRAAPPQKHGHTRLMDREEWSFDARSSRRERESSRMEIDDSDDEVRLVPPEQYRRSTSALTGRMSSELKARLDTPAVAPRTMGILSSGSKTASHSAAPPAPTGHRIVVSNLQTSVTHEDIRELFEDIGPLVTSRLVRPGTAEVVYELHKDAVKAVDVYHNRQLDGQPMKCMLVHARPPTIPTSSRLNSLRPSSSSSGSYKLPTGGKSTVVPDISTIHKALFNKS